MTRTFKVLLLCFMVVFLALSISYASWHDEFNVFTDISTYGFDIMVNDKTINSKNAVESSFKLDENIVLEIENKSSVGIYIKKVVVEMKISNKARAANKMKFDGAVVCDNNRDAGIHFTGEALYENSPLKFRFSNDSHLIEPSYVDTRSYDIEIKKNISIKTILSPLRNRIDDFLDKKENLLDEISDINNQITGYEKEINVLKTKSEEVASLSAGGSENTTDEEQLVIDGHMTTIRGLEEKLLNFKQSIRDINNKIDTVYDEIDEMLYSYENDEIIITTYFEMFND